MRFEKTRWDESSSEIRPWRKRLLWDEDLDPGCVLLADEKLTSEAPDARILESITLEMTPLEVEWLYHSLKRLLKRWKTPLDEEEAEDTPQSIRPEESILKSNFSSQSQNQIPLFKE